MAQSSKALSQMQTVENRSPLGELPGLFKQLAEEVTDMANARVDLLRVEVKQEITTILSSSLGIAVGGFVALAGFVLGSIAIVFALAGILIQNGFSTAGGYALGLAIVGVPYLIVGLIVMSSMKNRLVNR